MKALVLKDFLDMKDALKHRSPGDEYEDTAERIEALAKQGFVSEVKVEAPAPKKPATKKPAKVKDDE